VSEFHFQNESNSASSSAGDLEIILKWVLTFQFDVFFFFKIYYTESIYSVYKDKLQNCSLNQFK